MSVKKIFKQLSPVIFGGAFSFAIGYFAGKSVGAPVAGGVTLGTAGVAQATFQILLSQSAKKQNWNYSTTVIAKSAASLLTSTAGRAGLIALSILYPGKARSAAIWTGVGLITGIAQLVLTALLHKMADSFDWNYSTLLLGQSILSALDEAASIITLVAVGILAPSGAGFALALCVPLFLTAVSLYNAVLLKYSGKDTPFRKVLADKIDPLATLYQTA